MDKAIKPEGAGLILSRKVGERIIVSADAKATPEQILEAIRAGIVISLVDVNASKGGNNRQDSRISEAQKQKNGNTSDTLGAPKRSFMGSARIGLKASPFISIAREEILDSYAG